MRSESPTIGTIGESTYADDVSFAQLLAVVRRHARVVLGVPFLLIVVAVGWAFIRPRTYSAAASFLPQRSDRASAGISSLVAQFGVALPTLEASQSPEFYVVLLRSNQLLGDVVESRFEVVGAKAAPGTLVDLMRVEGPTEALRRDEAIRRLRDAMNVVADERVGLVEVSVKTQSPELSKQVLHRVLELVNEFNVARRQSRATAERRFTEARRDQAQAELREAESALQHFLTENREFGGSPALAARRERLQREVDLRQAIYTSIAQAYEQARIEEVRDTPVITVLQSPEVPVRPDSRRLIQRLALCLVVGGLSGIALAFALERWRGRPAAAAAATA